MPITDRQREQRRKRIGSSDTPPICGAGYANRSIADVYLEKTMPTEHQPPTADMAMGNLVEGLALDWAAEQLGIQIRKNQFRVAKHDDLFAANYDALPVVRSEMREKFGLEAKYVAHNADEWGEAETDQVNTYTYLQSQHQMYVGDFAFVWVPVLLVRFSVEPRMYKVERNEDVIQSIIERGHDFWQKCVLPRRRPEGTPPSLDVLKRVKREPNKTLPDGELSAALVEEWRRTAAESNAASKMADQAKAAVIAALGDAEAACVGDQLVTYFEQTRKLKAREASVSVLRQLKSKKRDNG